MLWVSRLLRLGLVVGVVVCAVWASLAPAAVSSPVAARRIHIIRSVWKRAPKLGVAIASCESGLDTHARDYASGTHWGLFQEGEAERAAYGWGSGAWKQAESGYKLFLARGTSPWDSSRRCWSRRIA